MPSIHEILEKYWGYRSFRPSQEEIINSVLAGNDTLALLPTGGGKSICFQVPALTQDGICIVVSPLIALMKDQVENLVKKGIKAIAITSAMHKREIDIALDNCVHGKIKFLYLSPERLETEIVKVRLQKMNVNLIAIDESHCISQWGYDFRPSYLKIELLRDILPKVPVLALTATATKEVVKDIQEKLHFKKNNVIQKSFERKNVAYILLNEEDKLARLVKIANNVKGTGIVYVRNRKKTQEIARYLKSHNIDADFYHAGLDAKTRDIKQSKWINNESRVIVCTNAFGMGVDKGDVRLVVHYDLPPGIEEYYQEAGRAGRDGQAATCVLLHGPGDVAIHEFFNRQSVDTVLAEQAERAGSRRQSEQPLDPGGGRQRQHRPGRVQCGRSRHVSIHPWCRRLRRELLARRWHHLGAADLHRLLGAELRRQCRSDRDRRCLRSPRRRSDRDAPLVLREQPRFQRRPDPGLWAPPRHQRHILLGQRGTPLLREHHHELQRRPDRRRGQGFRRHRGLAHGRCRRGGGRWGRGQGSVDDPSDRHEAELLGLPGQGGALGRQRGIERLLRQCLCLQCRVPR